MCIVFTSTHSFFSELHLLLFFCMECAGAAQSQDTAGRLIPLALPAGQEV